MASHSQPSRLRTLVLAILLAGLVLGATLLIRPQWRYSEIKKPRPEASLRVATPLMGRTKAEYAFISPGPALAGVDVSFVTYNRKNPSTLSLTLKDRASGRTLARKYLLAAQVRDWAYHPWRFRPLDSSPGQEYLLEIVDHGAGPSSCLGLVAHDTLSPERLGFWLNGKEASGEPALAFIRAEPIPVWNSPLVWLAVCIGGCLAWLLPGGFGAGTGRGWAAWPEYLGCALIMGACLAFRVWRTTKGIDFTEEGMLLTTPLRYALGDLPFRHEIMNTFRMYDVLISPLFRLFPGVTVLQVRLFGLLLQASSLVAAFLFLRKRVRPLVLAALAGLILVVHDTYGLSVPSYNLVSAFFVLLSLLTWLNGLNSTTLARNVLWSGLAGVLAAGAALSYFTLAGMAVLPAFVLLAGLFGKGEGRTWAVSGLSFLIPFGALLSLTVAVVLAKGLGPDFMEATRLAAPTTELIKSGPLAKVSQVLANLAQFAPPALAGLGLGALALVLAKSGRSLAWPVLGLAVLVGVAGYAVLGLGPELRAHGTDQGQFWHFLKLPLMSLVVLLGLLVLGLSWAGPARRRLDPGARTVFSLGILWGLLATAIYSLSTSAVQPHAGFNGVPVLLLFSLVGIWALVDGLKAVPGQARFVSLILLLAPLILTFAGVRYSFDLTYRDGPATELTTPSAHPKLAGVVSSPRRMGDLDSLLEYLEGRVKPGDLLLTMHDLALVYFLTGTRPAVASSWIPVGWTKEMYGRIYQRIIDQDRVPVYCIRLGATDPAVLGAEERFLKGRFGLERKIGRYEVWRRIE